MSDEIQNNDESKSLDHLLDDALNDFKPMTATTTTTTTAATAKQPIVSSSETAPPPSDPLQTTFEAMCFNDEKFLNELDSLPNILSNFPFGLGQNDENDTDSNNIFNIFSQLGKHADLLQQIKDEDIEKALEKLAEQAGQVGDTNHSATTAANTNSDTTNEPHIEQLNLFMSSILSKDVMLPACQAVDESYDEWLIKNKDSLSEEDSKRYKNQHQCVKDICRAYDTTANDNQQMQRVLQKFQELQTYGDPPKELLFFPGLPGFGTSGEQNLFDNAFSDADKVGQNNGDCSVM
jgi:DNA-binding ferritin-like protein